MDPHHDSAKAPLGVVLFADPEPPPIGGLAAPPGCTLEPVAAYRPMPEVLLRHDPRLSEAERATVRAGRSAVKVVLSTADADPFRARKQLVRALGTVLGDNGAAALDVAAQRIWTREQLDDELAHDAPLDIEQMYTLHAVTGEDRRCYWLHSHGLPELGGVDFDILRPHPEHARDAAGLVRAMALASVEGRLEPGAEPVRPSSIDLSVRAVAADDFMRKATPDDARLRDPRDHTDRRVVLCDPRAKLLPAWLAQARPSTLFQVEPPDGAMVFYSGAASRMAAERARGTYARLRSIAEEFSDLGLPTLVKLGYEVDGAKNDEREHLWFEVHACLEGEVDATLTNSPHWIARMRRGERGRHSIERLSDWTIGTPIGSVTPRTLHMVRVLRGQRARVERLLAEHRRSAEVTG